MSKNAKESWLREMLTSLYLPTMHKEGLPFLIICFVVTIILGLVWTPLLWAGLVVTLSCYAFFRDPERVTHVLEGAVIAPADGVVQSIEVVEPPQGIGLDGEKMTRIAVFMSPLNVHVNRIPVDGEVIGLKYRPGKNLRASLDKAHEYNERQAIGMRSQSGHPIGMTQIAGFLARRIVCDLELGAEVAVGERYGIIRFGSRVDVYVPADASVVCVEKGQQTVSGETTLAILQGVGNYQKTVSKTDAADKKTDETVVKKTGKKSEATVKKATVKKQIVKKQAGSS